MYVWVYVLCTINWDEDTCEPIHAGAYDTEEECHQQFVDNAYNYPVMFFGHRCIYTHIEVQEDGK